MTLLAYARVSTTDQSLDVQLDQLNAAGCEKIFCEKASGKRADNRAEFQKCLAYAREGDVIVVAKLDRLARSVSDFCTIVSTLNEKGVGLKVLNSPIDTTNATGKFTATILMAVAELELSIRSERQREGIAKAKENGVYDNKAQKKKSAHLRQRLHLLKAENPDFTPDDLAKITGISRASVYRLTPGMWRDEPEWLAASKKKNGDAQPGA